MAYKTSDLSKILDVSSNTIRRYEERGYLSPSRQEDNHYRYFDNADMAKMVFISKYRKIGFSHEEIGQLFQSDIGGVIELCQNRLKSMDKMIAELSAIRHMLKDDIRLMERVDEYGEEIIVRDCVEFYYVTYQKEGKVQAKGARGEQLHRFMYQCPEIKYVYIFRKDNIKKGSLAYEEGIAVKKADAEKFGVETKAECVEEYPRHFSIMRIVRLPIDFMDESIISRREARRLLFEEHLSYIECNGYVLAGDAIGIKIGFIKVQDREEQYILLSMPVDKA